MNVGTAASSQLLRMKPTLVLFAIFIAHGYAESSCEFLRPDAEVQYHLYCTIKSPDGPLHEVLERLNISAHNRGETKPYSEWKPVIEKMQIVAEYGWFAQPLAFNITLSDKSLKNLPKLKGLSFHPHGGYYGRRPGLILSSGALKSLPSLQNLNMNSFNVSDESIEALLALKDQLNGSLFMDGNDLNSTVLYNIISQFTRLKEIWLGRTFLVRNESNICDPENFPRSIFQKSASTMEAIVIYNCPIGTLTRDIFKNLRNLIRLNWNFGRVPAIESGAFDDLVKLQNLDILGHEISILPNGLFNNNRKLQMVRFRRLGFNGIDGFSKANFSHVENFDRLNFTNNQW